MEHSVNSYTFSSQPGMVSRVSDLNPRSHSKAQQVYLNSSKEVPFILAKEITVTFKCRMRSVMA